MKLLKICMTALLIVLASPSLAKRASIFDNQTVQMSAQFQISLSTDPAARNADSAPMANARKSLYAQALDECAIIVAIFTETECKLKNLQITIHRSEKEDSAPTLLIGNAIYIVREK